MPLFLLLPQQDVGHESRLLGLLDASCPVPGLLDHLKRILVEVDQNFFILIPVSLFREFQREEVEGEPADG